jgi:hypothetical protein
MLGAIAYIVVIICYMASIKFYLRLYDYAYMGGNWKGGPIPDNHCIGI